MDQEFPPDPSTNPLEISEEELSESAEPMDMDGDLEEYDSNAEAETQSLQEFLDQEMEERQPSDMDELDSVHESQLDPTAGEQFMSSNEASPRISVVEVEEMGDVDIEQSYAQDDTILSAETNGPDSPEKPGSPLLEFVSPPAEAVASPSRPVSPVRVASPVKEDVKPETPLKPVSPVKEAVSVASPVREPARSVSPVREVVTPVKPASPVREVVTPVKPASPIREVVTSVKPASPVKAVSPVRVSSPAKDEEMKQASPIREPARLVSPEKAVSPVREAVQPATPLKAAVSPVREASPVRETAKLPERRQEITPKQTTASLNVPGITRSDIKVTASPINLSPTQTNAQTANVLKSVIAETPSKSSSPIIFKPTAVDLQTSEMAQIAKQTGFDLSLHSIIGLPKQHPVLDQLFKHLLKNANDKDTINALQSKNKRLEAEKQLAETNLKEQAKEFQQQTRELKQQLTESKHQNQKQHDLMSALCI
ncbi:hypothetical protein EDD86DRAFT_71669 [Gorgonomyces haynaldii]|nr:hypothetical protein EDD86DRAFT_71669 [Gorgonomyces haynaldii]